MVKMVAVEESRLTSVCVASPPGSAVVDGPSGCKMDVASEMTLDKSASADGWTMEVNGDSALARMERAGAAEEFGHVAEAVVCMTPSLAADVRVWLNSSEGAESPYPGAVEVVASRIEDAANVDCPASGV